MAAIGSVEDMVDEKSVTSPLTTGSWYGTTSNALQSQHIVNSNPVKKRTFVLVANKNEASHPVSHRARSGQLIGQQAKKLTQVRPAHVFGSRRHCVFVRSVFGSGDRQRIEVVMAKARCDPVLAPMGHEGTSSGAQQVPAAPLQRVTKPAQTGLSALRVRSVLGAPQTSRFKTGCSEISRERHNHSHPSHGHNTLLSRFHSIWLLISSFRHIRDAKCSSSNSKTRSMLHKSFLRPFIRPRTPKQRGCYRTSNFPRARSLSI